MRFQYSMKLKTTWITDIDDEGSIYLAYHAFWWIVPVAKGVPMLSGSGGQDMEGDS